MLGQILTELAIIVSLLILNGLFAMSEIAVVTARRNRLVRRTEEGDSRARAALELATEPAQFLSTVQVGITLVGTFAGAFGGATIAEEIAPLMTGAPLIGSHAEGVSLALVVAVITFLSVVIGELVPKRIALTHAEAIAVRVARPMRWLARAGGPIVRALTGSTELLLRLFRIRASGEPAVTEDDIRALVAQGTASGAVDAAEEEILDRVLRLGDRPAAAIMTPRTDIEWVDASADLAELRRAFKSRGHSRLLVCDGSVENVLGVLWARELLVHCLGDRAPDIRPLLRQPLFIPETMPLLQLLQQFRQGDAQTGVVLDEFGGVQGLVTLGDILADIVADLPGGTVPADEAIVRREDGSWLMGGGTLIEEVDEVVGVERPAAERRRGYRTLAGFMMTELGRLPRVGEKIDRWGHTFEVVDMDGRRIDRVLVTRTVAQKQG